MESVRVKGGALAAALVSGAVATGALSPVPTANASCFSIFGIGNGNGCTSNLTSFAIGIGEGAIANASQGYFGGALALGNNASATTAYSALTLASALGNNASASSMLSIFSLLGQLGAGSTSVIGGPNIALGVSTGSGAQTTSTIGGFNIIAQLGPGSASALGGANFVLGAGGGTVAVTGLGNIAGQLGPGNTQVIGGLNLGLGVSPFGSGAQTTIAGLLGTVALNILGDGNVATQSFFGGAVNLFGNSDVETAGIFATALNILGSGNTVSVLPGALLSVALGLVSNNVTVTSGPGPLSFAAALFQNGVTVGQTLGSALDDMWSPVAGATSATSRAIADAMSAASAGDLGGALTALAKLPGAVLDAFLFGYDADSVGTEDPLPGLLSAKDSDCTTQCHDGGPLYQFFVGLPSAIATAIANITVAAGETAETGDSPEVTVTDGDSESGAVATTLVSTVSPEADGATVPPVESVGVSEDIGAPAVGTVDETSAGGGQEVVDDSKEELPDPALVEVDEAEIDAAEIDEPETDVETDSTTETSDDAAGDTAPSPAKHAKSPQTTAPDTEDTDNDASDPSDDSSSSKSGGKHRAGPRHAK